MLSTDIPARVAERAATRFIETPSGCRESTYSVNSSGYAQIGWQDDGKVVMTYAHRAAWVHHHGEQIPDGLTIDHLCKTKVCVEPSHLRMLTNFLNAQRTLGRDWPLGTCIKGHPNSDRVRRGRKTVCRLCNNEWQRAWQQKNRARKFEVAS